MVFGGSTASMMWSIWVQGAPKWWFWERWWKIHVTGMVTLSRMWMLLSFQCIDFVSADGVDVVVPFLFEQMVFCGNGVAKDKETSLASAFWKQLLWSWPSGGHLHVFFSQNAKRIWKGRFGLTWAIKSFGACVARGFDAWQAWNDYPSTTLFPPSDGSIMWKATLRFVSGNCHKWKGKVPKVRGWHANILLAEKNTHYTLFLGGPSTSCEARKKLRKQNRTEKLNIQKPIDQWNLPMIRNELWEVINEKPAIVLHECRRVSSHP